MAPYGNQNSKGKGVTTASSDPTGAPSKRTLQNRKAQREFRKRREARVRELEDRCRRYDELGLEANVELQRVARRLKEENDALRTLLNNLGHGKLISTALETVHQQPQTPTGGAGTAQQQQQQHHFSDSTTNDPASSSSGLRSLNDSSASGSGSRNINRAGTGYHMTQKSNDMAQISSSDGAGDSKIGRMGPPPTMSTSASQRSARASAVHLSSMPADDSDSIAYNPPELLQRSALSDTNDLLSKLSSGLVGVSPPGSDDRRHSLSLAHHIDAAINNSRAPSVPSLLRLDLGARDGRTGADGQIDGPVSAQNLAGRFNRSKQELNSTLPASRLGPFGSMGLSVPPPPASTSAASSSTGPIISYSGGANPAYMPFVQPTSVNEALLNPNPIPFQFNLSQLGQAPTGISPLQSFNSLADQGAWWLSAGGPVLTPGQDPNALDEKAQALAAQQQHELTRSATQQSGSTSSTSGSNAASDGQQFDLSAFLNGGVTPGGSFKMDGNTAISGQMSNNNNNQDNTSRRGSSTSNPQVGSDRAPTTTIWEQENVTNPTSQIMGNQDDLNNTTSPSARHRVQHQPGASSNQSVSHRVQDGVAPATSPPPSSSVSSLSMPTLVGAASSSNNAAAKPTTAGSSSSPSGRSPSADSLDPPQPVINAAKQLLLDGAVPSSMPANLFSSSASNLHLSNASNKLGEGYSSITIPLKRTLSNSNGTGQSGSDGFFSPASAFLPPTKIFRASEPGAAGSMPIGLDNAESTRAFLQLLERRMAQADGGLGPLGVYEHLGFRPPSFVAAGANATMADGASTSNTVDASDISTSTNGAQ
ncbi:hypothetical protein OC846_002595 [Tilletia horrida]|uniref:BZIP domain-containing protein n=1 Tax=Tilletia horrida TaxID=155126 RepID=A0AAN6GRX1_9BASI|nr:hypothetical protein OC845_002866 [Tilletia horrida]KAK0553223.1 hypothetical protein OC846_002595 [Tilletia horrida]KAK0565293.1 hypothetical protein OC861_003840 [Tilletia horrida]